MATGQLSYADWLAQNEQSLWQASGQQPAVEQTNTVQASPAVEPQEQPADAQATMDSVNAQRAARDAAEQRRAENQQLTENVMGAFGQRARGSDQLQHTQRFESLGGPVQPEPIRRDLNLNSGTGIQTIGRVVAAIYSWGGSEAMNAANKNSGASKQQGQ